MAFTTGAAAIWSLAWRIRPVDIILMDLSLPGGLTGYGDVFTTIPSRPQFAAVPIMAVSRRVMPRSKFPRHEERVQRFHRQTHQHDAFAEQIAAVHRAHPSGERAGVTCLPNPSAR
ncbi:MAG: hypothetical protein IPK19_41525 [Chloroflexi bacterium]|nr:hypothetical protein [Chloroflexota bacterium]